MKQKGHNTQKKFNIGHILKGFFVILLCCALAAGGLIYYINYTKNNYKITFYQLTSDKVSENLRIIFLSDVHLAEYGEDNERLLDDIKSLNPNLILLGGDLVTYSVEDYTSMLNLCADLTELAPVYGIMGNHEDEKIYLLNDDELYDKFTATGAVFLQNQSATIEIGLNTVEIVGISGNAKSYELYGGRKEMEALSDEYNSYRICMAHIPALYLEELLPYSYDLALAGHTHGGIVRLPKLGGLYSVEEGVLPTYSGGEYTLENGSPLIVNCGLGDSNNVPRINDPHEVVVIDVNWY
jgi:hypothetical protein